MEYTIQIKLGVGSASAEVLYKGETVCLAASSSVDLRPPFGSLAEVFKQLRPLISKHAYEEAARQDPRRGPRETDPNC